MMGSGINTGRVLCVFALAITFESGALQARSCENLLALGSATTSITVAKTVVAGGVLERWVKKREAPARIIAAHSTAGKGDRTRPLCPYPQVARYNGAGSIDEASNFTCRAPP
jgi:hypothetical protein